LTPVVLTILPADFFDHGPATCLSVLLLGQTCPGCGITRAIQHLIHFDFRIAYAFNKLVCIVFPVLIIVYLKEFIRAYKIIRPAQQRES
jgi:hypothetical protein